MTIRVRNSAEGRWLRNTLEQHDTTLHLYTSVTPDDETADVGDFVEATGGGYAPIPIAKESWSFSEGDPTIASSAVVTFAFTSAPAVPGMVGWYLTQDDASGALLADESFPATFTVGAGNLNVSVQPRITAS